MNGPLAHLEDSELYENYTKEIDEEVSADAAIWLFNINLATCLPAIFAAFLLIPNTDKIGRKSSRLPALCRGAAYALTLVLVSYQHWPLEVLFAGCVIQGLSGSHITFQGTSFAYTADVITFEERTFRFTILNALIVGSASISNVSLGFLIDAVGFEIPFVVMTCLYAINAVYILLVVPESRNLKGRTSRPESVEQVLKTTVNTFNIYSRRREDPTARAQLCFLICGIFCCALTFLGRSEVDTLFIIGDPFYFSSTMVGVFIGVRAVVWLTGELTITRLTQPYIGDATRGIISVVTAVGGSVCLALAQGDVLIWLCESILLCSSLIPSVETTHALCAHLRDVLIFDIVC